jgi:hypothetical protein
MNNRTPRNIQLLSQISENNPFKKTVVPRVFDIGHDLEKDMETLGLNRNWSVEGRRNEAQKLIRSALRDWRDLQKPIQETAAMRAEARMPAFDKADIVGAMNRRELRDASRAMTLGQREMRMIGKTRSTDFLDAILEQEPWVSGIDIYNPNELQIWEEAKQERLKDLHGPLLESIAARETVESEALMVANVVRGDIAADSGLESREFEEVAKAVETGVNAHWLRKDKDANGNEVIYVLVPEGGGFRGQIADAETVRNGHFFKNHEEYLASRAA